MIEGYVALAVLEATICVLPNETGILASELKE
jgi:hypothetical protein